MSFAHSGSITRILAYLSPPDAPSDRDLLLVEDSC